MSAEFGQDSAVEEDVLAGSGIGVYYERPTDSYIVFCLKCGPLSRWRDTQAAEGMAHRHKRQVHS